MFKDTYIVVHSRFIFSFNCALFIIHPGACTFEVDQCTWRNVEKGDAADWLRASATSYMTTLGPEVDATTGESTGEVYLRDCEMSYTFVYSIHT